MMTLLIVIHVIACLILIALVLIQRGRGAGLVESFAGVESMFGTKTNAFLTRTTTIMSIIFFITCLSLAVMSVRQSKSLMLNARTSRPKAVAQTEVPPTAEASKTEAVKTEPVKTEAITPQQPPVKSEASPAANLPSNTAKPDATKTK
ncbi:MAG: preprotein translocase subunit SecG [Candidatus Omnitrophota bacterium]